jgi:hypothetical protein
MRFYSLKSNLCENFNIFINIIIRVEVATLLGHYWCFTSWHEGAHYFQAHYALGIQTLGIEMLFNQSPNAKLGIDKRGYWNEISIFLPHYDHALHIQFIWLNKRQKLNPPIARRKRRKLNPYNKVEDQIYKSLMYKKTSKLHLGKKHWTSWLHAALSRHLNVLDTIFGLA